MNANKWFKKRLRRDNVFELREICTAFFHHLRKLVDQEKNNTRLRKRGEVEKKDKEREKKCRRTRK